MQNVLDITSRLPDRPPIDVDLPLAILKRLFAVNKISRHALFIGNMVLSKFQDTGEYSCALTRQNFASTYVLLDGEPLSGNVKCEIDQLAHALYSLQCYCGLYNHVKAHRNGKGTDRYNHFAMPATPLTEKELYALIKSDTPIYFMWKPEDAEAILNAAKEIIEHGLMIARFAHIKTTNK